MPRKKFWKKGLAAKERRTVRESSTGIVPPSSTGIVPPKQNIGSIDLHNETGQIETGQIKTEQIETEQIETEQIETKEIETKEIETGQIETKQIETGQIETEQIETKQIETDTEMGKNANDKEMEQNVTWQIETGDEMKQTPTWQMHTANEIKLHGFVQGSFHQGDSKFLENSGKQCVANSFASMVYSKIKKPCYWNFADLDLILECGNKLYESVKQSLRTGVRFLLVSELPDQGNLFAVKFQQTHGQSLAGLIFTDADFGFDCDFVMSLKKALQTALSNYPACLVTFLSSTFAIFKTDDYLCVFDAHSRNPSGMQVSDGKSTLIKYRSIEDVHKHCIRLARSMGADQSSQYEVTGIHVMIDDVQVRSLDTFLHESQSSDVAFMCSRRSSFPFKPLTKKICSGLCEQLGIDYFPDQISSQGTCADNMGDPCRTTSIGMDGNCFFRAVCYSISGTEQNHRRIRLAVVKHLKQNADCFRPFLRASNLSVEDYISNSRMGYVNTWATELEILAACDLLKVDIFTFSGTRWLRYSRSQLQDKQAASERAIYLKHCNESHYEVVNCVRLTNEKGKICNGKCGTYDTIRASHLRLQSKRPGCHIGIPSAEKQAKFSKLCKTDLPKAEFSTQNDRQTMPRLRSQSRYISDENFRELKKKRAALRYQCDPLYKKQKQTKSRLRYATDKWYKTSVNQNSRQRYAKDIVCKSNTKANSKKKYAEDVMHKSQVKAYSKQKYAKDVMHKSQVKAYSKQKYAENITHKLRLKAYSKQKYAEDVMHKSQVKAYSKQKYAENVTHKLHLKAYSKQKYAEDGMHKSQMKAYSKRKYAEDVMHKSQVKAYSKRKYAVDVKHKSHVKAYSKSKYAKDTLHKSTVKAYNKAKYTQNTTYRRNLIDRYCNKYKTDSAYRECLKVQNVIKRKKNQFKKTQIANAFATFKSVVKQGPDHICSVCHRRLFPKEVIRCKKQCYSQRGLTVQNIAEKCILDTYLHKCSEQCSLPCVWQNKPSSKLWICYTCHRKLLAGKMPAEAAVNNLHMEPVPNKLKCLNSVERHLISKHIPFLKVMSLPRGGQFGAHGPVVCVPSNIDKSVSTLPRCASEDQMLRVKIKRKLTYKGHYNYQFVNPARVREALACLEINNKFYHDVTFNSEWVNPLQEETAGNEVDIIPDTERTEISGNGPNIPDTDVETENSDMSHTPDHGMYMDSCLQPVDIGQEILDQHFDKILCIAPAEGNDPIKILMDETNEAKSFPVLFPTGTPTYGDDREERITIARYLHTRLMLADTRFAKDTDYIFYAQYLSEVYQVLSSVSIALRKGNSNTCSKTLSSNRILDRESLGTILKYDDGYRFLKPIRGTPAFWQTAQKDLFAMLRQLGIPTWFCSFSAGDMRWNEIVEVLMKEEGDTRTVHDLDWCEKCSLLRRNPVTAARMFDHRFHCFLKEVILSPANPIGKISDYFYRVEFQQRGSPHTHCLFWVENAPQLDKDSDEDIAPFIDKYVTCEVPTSDDEELRDIVQTVQKHSTKHSKSCKKKGTTCRFNYPRPPSKRTFVSRPSEKIEEVKKMPDGSYSIPKLKPDVMRKHEAKEILKLMWKELENNEHPFETVDDLFHAINIDQEKFEDAYGKLSTKASIVLQRKLSDVWINQYNADLLRCWDANMDIQYVLDAYSCVVYIISYISKAEREMGLLLDHAKKETLEGNEDAKQAMKKLGGVYLHNREVSAQEAVYRVCNLHLKECSRKVQFIPTGENIVKISLPLDVIQRKSKGGADNSDIWMTSLIDRYKNRPNTTEFNDMCLASFCSEYRVVYKSEMSRVKKGNRRNAVCELQNGLGFVQKRSRTKPAVIRYARFSPKKQAENYYQSILQLFLPYRYENQLKPESFVTYENFYETGAVKLSQNIVKYVKDITDQNMTMFERDADAIDRAAEVLEKCGPLEDAWAQICPETEVDRLSCLDEGKMKNPDPQEDGDIPDLFEKEKKNYTIAFRQTPIPFSEAQVLLRSLNEKQKEVFYAVRQWCLNKSNGNNPQSFHLYISGGAGTGKSHLIKSIYYEAIRILARSQPSPDDISVLLTAPTGVAAFNINASTIHSTFSIGVDSKLPYQPLGEEKLNSLRSKLNSLQILVIDEISMVDHKLLTYIHGRLRQIKQCRDYSPFGGVSVIAVGDFYQLSPVKGKPLHTEGVGMNLWSDNFHIVELTEIMRQKHGAFAATLNRLRTRKRSEEICTEDIQTLSERETGEESDAIHIFATNKEVDAFNLEKLHLVCSDIIPIDAQDFAKDPKSGKLEKRESQFIRVVHSNLPRRLTLGEGARVMLTKNIDISDGLVNGVFGTVSSISLPDGESFPSLIYVIFDNEKVGDKLRKQSSIPKSLVQNSTPISPQEDRVNSLGGMRRQFPLKLSFACTIHKLQGITLEKAVVSLAKIFAAGQAYVALSRVTSLDGLVVKDFKESVIYCNEKVAEGLSAMTPFVPQPYLHTRNTGRSESCEIILHNVQGLKSHLEDIKADKRFMRADFICMTETWLSNVDGQEEPGINGYRLHHKTRQQCYDSSNEHYKNLQQQAHGGVGFFSKVDVACEVLNFSVCNLECLIVYAADNNVALALMYRPVSYNIQMFRRNLSVLLEELDKLPHRCILMGDFNEDFLKSSSVNTIMQERNYRQLVSEPTTENGTLIDHVYVRGLDHVQVHVLPTYFSYHEAISIVFSDVC